MKIKANSYTDVNDKDINKRIASMALKQYKKGEQKEESENQLNILNPMKTIELPNPKNKVYSVKTSASEKSSTSDEFIRKSNYLLNDIQQLMTTLGLNKPEEIYGGGRKAKEKATPQKQTEEEKQLEQQEKEKEPEELRELDRELQDIDKQQYISEELKTPSKQKKVKLPEPQTPAKLQQSIQNIDIQNRILEINSLRDSLPGPYLALKYHDKQILGINLNPKRINMFDADKYYEFLTDVKQLSTMNSDQFVELILNQYKNIRELTIKQMLQDIFKSKDIYSTVEIITAMRKYLPNFKQIYRRNYGANGFNVVDRNELWGILVGTYDIEKDGINIASKDYHARIKTINNLVDDLLMTASSLNKFKGYTINQVSKIKDLYEQIAIGIESIILMNKDNSQILKLKSSFQSLYDTVSFNVNYYSQPTSISGGSLNASSKLPSFIYTPNPKPKTNYLYYL